MGRSGVPLYISPPITILDIIFPLLRDEKLHPVKDWDERDMRHDGPRDLCVCALVSHAWRDAALRNIWAELVFPFRHAHPELAAQREAGVDAEELDGFGSPESREEEFWWPSRDLYALDDFLETCAHLQPYPRVLRLMAQPIVSRVTSALVVGSMRPSSPAS